MALQIYNTLKRSKETFVPISPGKISMYVCGNTVYDYAHIGHARVMVGFDVIVRHLRATGWNVTYVRNITDIDDKILNRAAENNELFSDLTERMISAQHQDERALGIAPPDIEPRATAHIADIIDMVQHLIDNHYAYNASNGDVYYRVKRFPDYGKLSGKNPDELLAGARIDIETSKEDPRDFALWKAAPESETGWQSPWGWGRPGWHIECSAMSTCHLGNSFDIHGGGPDLVFPHHENEIAQSEAATHQHYVNYWMHAGAVRVNDEKMSKSLGNFFTIREVLEKYHPEVIRFLLVSSHYRSPINYSEDNLIEAKSGLERLYGALRGITGLEPEQTQKTEPSAYHQRFIAAMNDDFNTSEAIAVLYDIVREINTAKQNKDQQQAFQLASELRALAETLGVCQVDPDSFFQGSSNDDEGGLSSGQIEALINERLNARQNKDFARSDEIRDSLKAQGIILEDSKGGTSWKRG